MRILPSKGFISASLEIVAAAPLAAVDGQSLPRIDVVRVSRTCRKRMMLVALSFIASEGVLRGFVRCKIDSMRRTCNSVSSHYPH
jgi:hypothetical protein